ncbi:MAG: ABC transporter substrate-binding protein [Firmicutes bacterium]|nr:ABC transporter substrate-binding protein [Bacillota bacterium]
MRKLLSTFIGLLVVFLTFGGFAYAYNEAPMLHEQVEAGLLPPVEERLPENPLVIKPLREVGKYGGTWVRWSTSRSWSYVRMMMYGHSPIRWEDDGLAIEPNWVESWESNPEATVWTFNIRKGVRWSDGHPLTTEDFMFWWNDMVLNLEMSDPVPDMFIAGGETALIEALDDYTFRVTYKEPAPLLIERLCMWPNAGHGERLIVPAHYLKQYHPDYSDFDNFEVFEEKMEWWVNPECPVLSEWMPAEHEPARRLILTRNPYFYAIDTEGNQLPYIDTIEVNYVENMEMIKLRLLNGEGHMQLRPYIDMSDMAMFQKNASNAGYNLHLWNSGSGTGPIVYLNWNHPDPDKMELYRMPEFRRALSLAINRSRMHKMVHYTTGELTTGTFSPNAIEFHRTETGKALYEEWRDMYVEYDPDAASAILDSIGVVDQNGDGWRDLPNGEPLTLRIDMDVAAEKIYTQSSEMTKADWEAIGLRTSLNPVDGSQMGIMDQTATFDVRDSWGLSDGPNFLVFPQWVAPIDLSRWAPLNGAWYSVQGTAKAQMDLDKDPRDRTPPREAPEPGGPVDRLQKLYDIAKVETDEDKRDELVHQMIRIHIDEGPFFIGTVAQFPRPLVVSNKMHNVPDGDDLPLGGYTDPWIMSYPAITNPAQYWLDE